MVPRDLNHIQLCKNFLAILDGSKTIGTLQEMVYAKLYGKQVCIITTDGSEKSPWIRYHCPYRKDRFFSVESFESSITKST